MFCAVIAIFFNINYLYLLILKFIIFFRTAFEHAVESDFFADDVGDHESCAVFSRGLRVVFVLIVLGGVMEDQTLNIALSERTAVVFEYEPIVVKLHFNMDFLELVVSVFSVLDQLPNPTF